MKNIQFLKNWNGKLNCRIFSTLRASKGQEDYYGSKIGTVFNVFLHDKIIFPARLISARRMPFSEIPPELLYMDTGRGNMAEAITVFEGFYGANFNKSHDFYLLVFEKVQKEVSP